MTKTFNINGKIDFEFSIKANSEAEADDKLNNMTEADIMNEVKKQKSYCQFDNEDYFINATQ